jgi:hypothetical protein
VGAAAAVALVPGNSVVASPIANSAAAGLALNLQGGYRNATLSPCHIRHHYTFYHHGHRVPFNGTLSPPPGKHFLIKVKVKMCVHGRFRTINRLTVHVSGRPTTGHYDGSLPVPRRGSFFARAYYYGTPPGTRAVARSDKQYFRVR